MSVTQNHQVGVDTQELLLALAETLDVSPTKYEEAKGHYEAVGDWLNKPESRLAQYNPVIYPQGSFALGTAVRPLGDEEYDVDAVCLLDTTQNEHSQQELKKLVGDRLKEHGDYKRMLAEPDGRRCWTLNYAESSKFHLDILPAIPDSAWPLFLLEGVPEDWAQHAICITDKETWAYEHDWPKSNPKGYLEWFKKRMEVVFNQRRLLLAKDIRAEVQDIPEYKVRTPLQRLVQLLKRHRDIMFEGDECKPISIIITTLAASAYQNEDDIQTALQNVIPNMRNFIENRNGVYWIPNPVNPEENFADRWQTEPEKAEAFFQWLDGITRLAAEIPYLQTLNEAENYLRPHFGNRDVTQALNKLPGMTTKKDFATQPSLTSVPTLLKDSVIWISRGLLQGAVSWKESPVWPMTEQNTISINAKYEQNGFRPKPFSSNSAPLPKHCSLRFKAQTNVRGHYDVYWQVVNTGDEAIQAGGLRGRIFSGNLNHGESTLYRGSHSIECYIVKGGVCVARSGPFIVNIA